MTQEEHTPAITHTPPHLTKTLAALSQHIDPAAEQPTAFATEDGQHSVSITPAEREWIGWVNGAAHETRREINVQHGRMIAQLSVVERKNAFTRRTTARTLGRWIMADETNHVPVTMTPEELAQNIAIVTQNRWSLAEQGAVDHPRSRFGRTESADLETQVRNLAGPRYRLNNGYNASNQLDTTSPWDVDLHLIPYTESYYSGAIRIVRRPDAKGSTTLPDDLQVHLRLAHPQSGRILQGDMPGQGMRFTTANGEEQYLSNAQRAELHSLLAQSLTSEVLRPNPDDLSAIPRERCQAMHSDTLNLLRRLQGNTSNAEMGSDSKMIFAARDPQGRPAIVYVRRGVASTIVDYICYDPLSTAQQPRVQLQHHLTFSPDGVDHLEVGRIDRDNPQLTAQKIVDLGPNPTAGDLLATYRPPEQTVSAVDTVETIGTILQQLAASDTQPHRGFLLLP